MATTMRVSHVLLEAAERLVAEHDDYPAGSVLRCFARAVRMARASGVTLPALAAVSEEMARAMLATRANGPRDRQANRELLRALLPRQRRP